MNSEPNQVRGTSPPVFNCIVHVGRADSTGLVVARVANLAGLEGRARSEREAIAQVVAAFKSRLAAHVAAADVIAWIDPPAPLLPGEAERLIAVHL